MKLKLYAPCEEITDNTSQIFSINSFTSLDIDSAANLMVDSYRGTTDWEEGDSEEVARDEILNFLQGGYGEPLLGASFTAFDHNGIPVSQMATSLVEGEPTILFIYTHPLYKGQGAASFLISAGGRALLKAGYPRLNLYVSEENPALNLYQRLGFGR